MVYSRKPIMTIDNIPVFSERNEYIINYEKIANEHLNHFGKTGENPWMEEEFWKDLEASTRKLINKYSKLNGKILDVGVGLGRLLSETKHVNKYGMDVSIEYLKIAAKKSIKVCMSLVEDMPYKEGVFDMVVCTDVLEHVLDVNLAIKKILSVIKQNGYLIVRVPYKEDLTPYLDPTYPFIFSHLRNFDENSLRLIFEKIFKCAVEDIQYCGYLSRIDRLKYDNSGRFRDVRIVLFWYLGWIPQKIFKILIKLIGHDMILKHIYYFFRKFYPDRCSTIIEQLKGRNIELYEKIIKDCYNPIDINIVVKKK